MFTPPPKSKNKIEPAMLASPGGWGGDPIINKCYPKLDLAIYCKFHDSAKCFPIVQYPTILNYHIRLNLRQRISHFIFSSAIN